MEITVERFGLGTDSTLGELRVDGLHHGFTLEDERRRTKVHGETCIPVGRYAVRLRAVGELHRKYAARFPDVHRGMLWLQEVPGFQWIYLHIGNDEGDTDGCPLVGRFPVVLPDGEFKVAESTVSYLALYRKAVEAMDRGEGVFVTIQEREPLP